MLAGDARSSSAGAAAREIERVGRWLAGARFGVALTGAGISTESGLPDFRSAQGLWRQADPGRVASLTGFRRDPEAFYRFYRTRLAALAGAAPNPAHRAVEELERLGALRLVITQNVDGLHQQAGARTVVELHGNLRHARCSGCGARCPIGVMVGALADGALPRCPQCADLLRPDVVLFEELLPQEAFARAEEACRRCDLLLIVGSSLEVYPAAGLPETAAEAGARLVIVNREPTGCDPLAAAVLRGSAGAILPAVAEAVARFKADPCTERERD